MKLTAQKFNKFSKGFTLIELLVVIAILGVLVVGLMVAINPADKINQASDSRVISDIGALSRATESYATVTSGYYPENTARLTSSAELKAIPSAPSGYSAYVFTALPALCTGTTAATQCSSVTITGQLKSTKYAATPFWRFESSTGKSCAVATAATACP